jgi:hypothetical protein
MKPPKRQTTKKAQTPVKKKQTPKKSNAGRKSAYDELEIADKLELIEAWARDGKTDEEIYKSLKVSHDTFYKWKREKPEFADALKSGKEITDYRVEKSLYKRAVGYSYIEEHRELVRAKDTAGDFIVIVDEYGNKRYLEELKVIKSVKKEVSPDTAAAFIWLKNRKPTMWKDRQENLPPASGVPVFIDDIGDE